MNRKNTTMGQYLVILVIKRKALYAKTAKPAQSNSFEFNPGMKLLLENGFRFPGNDLLTPV